MSFQEIIDTINSYMSDWILLILLVGAGLFFTIRTKFVQVRFFGEGVRNLFKRNTSGKKGISSFGALATAVAAQVGTGNIVGACGAILIGGPGAIFWMWIIAFLGMSTIYAEAVLAHKTRIKGEDGTYRGGPVYYIKTAFKGKFGKFLAGFFAIAIILALGFFGATVQSNSISSTMNTAFGIPAWVIGLVVALIVGVIIIGGAKRIASVAEKIVPFMAIIYLLGGIVVLCMRITYIPDTIVLIFTSAFNPTAAIGGAFGATIAKAITQGAKRGLFSNEAGMGSTPHAHALSENNTAHQQGTVAMIGVFIDTFVVLTITALVVISTLYTGDNPVAHPGMDSSQMAQIAFGSVWTESVGNIFVAICLLFFAFTTIIGWNLFGKINVEYISDEWFGKERANKQFKLFGLNFSVKKIAVLIYSLIALGMIVFGSLVKVDLVWSLTDFFNQFMVIPNMIALLWLSNTVVKEVNASKKKKKSQELLDGMDAPVVEGTDAPVEETPAQAE
ncbi:MAG: sodium:alanine symporter family protein [Clostridiales bacterium]|nr:sodium:alanine symporter family protein [Clostridiales bacterium]